MQGQIIPNQTNALLLLTDARSLCSFSGNFSLQLVDANKEVWQRFTIKVNTEDVLLLLTAPLLFFLVESSDCEENHRLSGCQCTFILKLQVLCFGCLLFYRQRWAHLYCMLKLSAKASIVRFSLHEVYLKTLSAFSLPLWFQTVSSTSEPLIKYTWLTDPQQVFSLL